MGLPVAKGPLEEFGDTRMLGRVASYFPPSLFPPVAIRKQQELLPLSYCTVAVINDQPWDLRGGKAFPSRNDNAKVSLEDVLR